MPTDYLGYAFGALVAAGGAMGYVKKRSVFFQKDFVWAFISFEKFYSNSILKTDFYETNL